MKYLVTGGNGFIGSNLVDRLVSEGNEVVVIDNKSAESNEEFYFNDQAKYYEFCICDKDNISSLFKGVDVVFHLAAESRIQPTLKNPVLASQINVTGTCTVLQCAKENNVKRLIYSSTSSGYGLKNKCPLREDMPNDCLNPYSVTKIAGEDLCNLYSDLFGLETVSLRYFNVYGDRQPLKGQYAPVVGIFLRQSKEGEEMTIVGDGTQRRDFTHVEDIVEANIKAADLNNKKPVGEVINVGTGTNFSILEIAKMINDNYTFIPFRPGEAQDTLADTSKLKKLLDINPKSKIKKYIENQV